MKFGIESYSLAPPFSAIISIILILGFYKIGKLIFKINLLRDTVGNVSNLSYQYIKAIDYASESMTDIINKYDYKKLEKQIGF